MSQRTASIPSGNSASLGELAAERTLVERLRAGDETAFETLVRTCTGALHATAMRLLRDREDAAEAVQDALLLAFRAIDRFRGDARLLTWLRRIVINASLMKLRQRHRQECPIEELLPRFGPDGHRFDPQDAWQESPEELLGRRDRCALVRRQIDRLPDAYRTVLFLRDIEGIDTAQTARLLRTTRGAVKLRLHRARMALRELLTRELRG